MDLSDFFGPEPAVVNLRATDRWEAIDELVLNLVSIKKLKSENRDAISALIKKRESSMSTGIGFGIGMPHATTDLVRQVVGIIGRSPKGIQFDALDGGLVNLVFLFLVPQGEFQKYLHTLANIARLMHDAQFRDELRRRFL
jgi:mannitol/fructose-specific phosphotransferase system IIA component (Ntr-type)